MKSRPKAGGEAQVTAEKEAAPRRVDYDGACKVLFSTARMVVDLVRGYARELDLDEIDYTTLEPASPSYLGAEAVKRYGDLLWKVQTKGGRPVYVLVLLEFQSSVQDYMAVRLMTYVGLLYESLCQRQGLPPAAHPGAGGAVLRPEQVDGRGQRAPAGASRAGGPGGLRAGIPLHSDRRATLRAAGPGAAQPGGRDDSLRAGGVGAGGVGRGAAPAGVAAGGRERRAAAGLRDLARHRADSAAVPRSEAEGRRRPSGGGESAGKLYDLDRAGGDEGPREGPRGGAEGHVPASGPKPVRGTLRRGRGFPEPAVRVGRGLFARALDRAYGCRSEGELLSKLATL